MNDTRLLQIKSLARDIEEACAEMLDEGIPPHEMLHVARCKAFAAAARKSAAAAEDR